MYKRFHSRPYNFPMLYKDAGVNLNKAQKVVEIVKNLSLKGDEIGGFGGLFELGEVLKYYEKPVLVSSTDGVGTKIMLALEANYLEPIGIDLVAMCVNDILTVGARPLFFLDYYATGRIDEVKFESIIKGINEGLKQSGGILLGGETAELPGMIDEEIFDVAGFVVGIVDKNRIPRKEDIKPGDVVLGLPSNGIHSNGFSLVRKVLKDKEIDIFMDYGTGQPLYIELLKPTRIYVKDILKLLDEVGIKGMAHVTGGGLVENTERALPEGRHVEIYWDQIKTPWIFEFLMEKGDIPVEEMRRVFNMGVGFVVITDSPDKARTILPDLQEIGVVR